jgi:hypothetical protein
MQFNSSKSFIIWFVGLCLTGFIASIGADTSVAFIFPVLGWFFIGQAISDFIADEDWHGLKRFLLILTLVIVIILVVSLFWE